MPHFGRSQTPVDQRHGCLRRGLIQVLPAGPETRPGPREVRQERIGLRHQPDHDQVARHPGHMRPDRVGRLGKDLPADGLRARCVGLRGVDGSCGASLLAPGLAGQELQDDPGSVRNDAS